MTKFPMNKRVKVDSNEHYDFYIMHCGRDWYVEAFPHWNARSHSQDTRRVLHSQGR